MRGLRSSCLVALAGLLPLACGEFFSGEGEPADSPDAGDVDATPGVSSLDDAGSTDGGDGTAGDGAAPTHCREAGAPSLDPTFGIKTLSLAVPQAAVDSLGRVVAIGRAACGDAGETLLSMQRFLPTGAADLPSPCFGTYETPRSLAAGANGFVLATAYGSGPLRTHIRRVGYDGTVTTSAQTPGSTTTNYYPNFALEVSGKIVWGGLSYTSIGPHNATLGVVYGNNQMYTAPTYPNEEALSAATSGSNLYVAFVTVPTGAEPRELVLRKYSVPVNALVEDTTFSNAGRTRLTLTGTPLVGGLGAMVVGPGDTVTLSAAVSGVVTVLRFDTSWHTVKQIPGASAQVHLLEACDGVLVADHGGPTKLSRLEPDGGLSTLDLAPKQIQGVGQRADGAILLLHTGSPQTLAFTRP